MERRVAFWALLELYKRGEVRMVQAEPFAPIRVARVGPRLIARSPSGRTRPEEAVA